MLSGEPETTDLPMRRLGLALVASFVVGAIAVAGVGIYGFINPSGGKPSENDIIIMRETGARFVFVEGRLHPVLNFTSAQLIVGGAKAPRTMSQQSLDTVERGRPLGIEGAPDPVPAKKSLLGLPWSVCAAKPTGATAVRTTLRVGTVPPGGTALADQALLVTTSAGEELPMYLLVGGFRLRVDDRTVLTALELTATSPTRVTPELLNSVPAGPNLAAATLAKAGSNSSKKVAGSTAKIGQVYRSGQQSYVLTAEGLAPIGEVMAALLTAGGGQSREVSPKDAADALSNQQVEPDGFPKTKPTVQAEAEVDVCAVYRSSAVTGNQASTGRTVSVEVFPVGSTQPDGPDQSTAVQRDGARTADRVIVPEGRGALVRGLPAPGVEAQTTVHVVTDQGQSFALGTGGDVDVQEALGYGGVKPVPVPAAMLALLPQGPTLDPAAARAFLPVPGATPSLSPVPAPSPSQSSKPPASPSESASKASAATTKSSLPPSTKPATQSSSRRRTFARSDRNCRRRRRRTRVW
jgi:type VII secretion protein EccB